MHLRELFLQHIAQTSPNPLAFEIEHAQGCILTDVNGKKYIDLIGGISVANIGHRHPSVIEAIKQQLDKYLHVMVYGEFIQSPQVQYAKLLTDHLPPSLDSVYFTNSGAEAVEGAMKLAKRYTGRSRIISFEKAYHGSTQGALSIIGDEYWRNAYRPLLPGIVRSTFNSYDAVEEINSETACVIMETIQGEAGIIVPDANWLSAIQKKCTETGTLLVLDEIQCGFGRTGTLWGFEQFGIIPDILLLGKALGGGLPLGAFISSRKIMNTISFDPILGHITTFGGHPLSCAAGLASMKALFDDKLMDNVRKKETLFLSLLKHELISSVRSCGLWMAVTTGSSETTKKIIDNCLEFGLLTDWFLFDSHSLRISPPLTITEKEIRDACSMLLEAMDQVSAV